MQPVSPLIYLSDLTLQIKVLRSKEKSEGGKRREGREGRGEGGEERVLNLI